MLKFILRRCLEAIPTLFILITISFFMMRLAPGSPFTGERTLPPEVMANIEAKYHLNDPIMTQYFSYLKQLAHGDFGPSFKYKDYSVNDRGCYPQFCGCTIISHDICDHFALAAGRWLEWWGA